MIGGDHNALHGNKRFDPFARPGAVSIGCKFAKRTEGESCLRFLSFLFFLPCPDLVVIAARSQCQRIKRFPLVEGKDLRAFIAPELCGDQRQQGRFAGPRRSEDQRMADIVDMKVQPEGRRAAGDLHQRWGRWRIEGAWRGCAPCPDGIDRDQIGKIGRVDQRLTDIGV